MQIQKTAKTVLAAFLLSIPMVGLSEDTAATTNTQSLSTTQSQSGTSASKILATLDLRTEYTTRIGSLNTANYVDLGYQFNPDLKVLYYQEFNTNLYKSTISGADTDGLALSSGQSFVHVKVGNILKNGNLSANYEGRVYIPTWRPEIEAGNITRLYSKVSLSYQAAKNVKFTLSEVLTPQIFKTSGVNGTANPAIQNRVYFITDIDITSKLSLSIPILAYQTKLREYADDSRSGSWQSLIYIWPELGYAVNDNVTVGLSYYSDNLLSSDLKYVNIGQGLERGAVQAFITTSL